MGSPNFSFNKRTQRYHYTNGQKKGQFVSTSQVRDATQNFIDSYKDTFAQINQDYSSGKIPIAAWENKLADAIREVTVCAYKVANPAATTSDWGEVGRHLQKQYTFLRNFTRQVHSGNLSDAQIQARANQYLQAAHTVFNNATRDSYKDAGFKWERRLLTSKEPCQDCPKYAEMGWQSIGSLPKVGEQCECKSHCRCYFEFSQSYTMPKEHLLYNGLNILIKQIYANSRYFK
jgi:hypothetical protein